MLWISVPRKGIVEKRGGFWEERRLDNILLEDNFQKGGQGCMNTPDLSEFPGFIRSKSCAPCGMAVPRGKPCTCKRSFP